ncbi:tail tubular protein B [Xanthomonas phage SB3]|uniref:Tail tubular protein B n=1 Tax=Xanthomonas phage SB3 TaxID=3117472 RepID=A0ABZ2GZH8_9CAUD
MKVGGTVPSLVQGVSQQEPHNRLPNQLGQQQNMLSSTTRGLTRRRGTQYLDAVKIDAGNATAQAESANMGRFSFALDEVEYTLLYRRRKSAQGKGHFAYLFNRTEGKFVPVVYEGSTWVDNLILGGASAVAAVGRYVYIAGNDTVPRVEQTDRWDNPTNNQKLAATVRAGAYSRKFTLTIEDATGGKVSVDYTTKASAYPEPLDVSNIPFWKPNTTPQEADPYYQKLLNDMTNEYNGKVNQWIKEAADDIQPANIAEKLAQKLIDQGITASNREGTIVVDDANYVDITIDDGGDGALAVHVGKEVKDEARLTRWHWNGKVVRIRPGSGRDSESFYMEARSENGQDGWQKVQWYETAGIKHDIKNMFAQLIVHEGTAYVAQDAAGLEALAPTSGTHVAYKPNKVGDGITAPVPAFFGKKITMMREFQDRLLIGAGNTVSASRSGDYLNYFRETVLSILDNDPVEMYAHGSEGDILKAGVMYQRDLVLFGNLRQYLLSGREVLTPTNRNITTIGSIKGSAEAEPIAAGNFVFFAKSARDRTSLHDMRPGQTQDTTTTSDVSTELDDYLVGNPVQLCGTDSPNLILYRTDADPSIVYVYQYLDSQSGRVQSSWSHWKFADVLGAVCGVDTYDDDVVVFSHRLIGSASYIVADILSLNTQLDRYPHLDSQVALGEAGEWHTASEAQLYVAARKGHEGYMLGTAASKRQQFIDQLPGIEAYLMMGAVSPAIAEPTNPFMRGDDGTASLLGDLIFSTGLLHVDDTGGVSIRVYRTSSGRSVLNYEGRLLGRNNNLLNTQPVSKGKLPFTIGDNVQNVRYELHSDSWLPLRITGLEWTGQYYNRVRRN